MYHALATSHEMGTAGPIPRKRTNLSGRLAGRAVVGEQTMSDHELLQQYLHSGSQDAFADLVGRHADWVYAAARRQLGDPAAAEDVTQAVFILLAQRGRSIRSGVPLSAWLFGIVRHVAGHAIRARERRHRHEARAALCLVKPSSGESDADPLLVSCVDEAVASLGWRDRQAILLRFYEDRPFAEVGHCLQISEEAARKRVSRALDQLRLALADRRLAIAPVVLERFLQSGMRIPAPVHVVSSSSAAALAGSSRLSPVAVSFAKGTLRMLSWNKAKVTVALLALVIMPALALTALAQSRTEQPASAQVMPNRKEELHYVMGRHVIITLSPDRRKAWGYSTETGQWAPAPSPAPENATIAPEVADNVAAFRAGHRVYGFSAVTGQWDTVDLSPEAAVDGSQTPMVSQDFAAFTAGTRLYAFSVVTGKWDSIQVPGNSLPKLGMFTTCVTATAGRSMYVFALKTGRWAGVQTDE
jgi:RNA polymerase sigma factor (sigma-70 family)